jgi:hypothetical protein
MDALENAQSNGKTASEIPGEEGFEFDYSLEDDLVPTHRTKRRKCVWDASSHLWKSYQLAEWKKRLCTSDDNMVKKTFLATTQLVPSVMHENQNYPKDHHVARFQILAHRRQEETVSKPYTRLAAKPQQLIHWPRSRIL